jgi:hypothetical protein
MQAVLESANTQFLGEYRAWFKIWIGCCDGAEFKSHIMVSPLATQNETLPRSYVEVRKERLACVTTWSPVCSQVRSWFQTAVPYEWSVLLVFPRSTEDI